MSFAIHTWERQVHADNTLFEIDLDVDNDGTFDYAVFNQALAFPTDLSSVTIVYDIAADAATAFFYTTHYTNSANTILTFCAEQIGMDLTDLGETSMDAEVYAVDWTFTGNVTDDILGLNIVPYGERYFTVFEGDNQGYIELDPESDMVGYEIQDFEDQLNETETGVLWLFGPGAPAYNEAKVFVLTEQEIFMPVIRP
jgi:hypothetical protein